MRNPHRDFEDFAEELELISRSFMFSLDHEARDRQWISFSTFFDEVYVSRSEEDEQKLLSVMLSANQLCILTGRQGSGKTTLLLWVLEQLPANVGWLLLDLKTQGLRLSSDATSPVDLTLPVTGFIKNELINRYVPEIEAVADFTAAALRTHYTARIQNLILEYRTSKQRDLGSEEALAILREDPKRLASEYQYLLSEMTVAECIESLKSATGMDKFLLVLDNIDALTSIHQVQLVSLAVDIFNAGAGSFGVVIPVRLRNVVRVEESPLGGDIIRVVSLSSSDALGKLIDLHPFKPDLIEEVLAKREDLAKAKAVEAGLASSEFWNTLEQLRSRLHGSFLGTALYELANHSSRLFLVLSCGFIGYIFRLVASGIIPLPEGEEVVGISELRSYLYRWLYAGVQNWHHNFMRDVVAEYYDPLSKNCSMPLSTQLSLTIAAWLANCRGRETTVAELVSDFERIGIDSERTLRELLLLYDVADPTKRHVEIISRSGVVSPESLSPQHRLLPTPLGMHFVTHTLLQFEFLCEALAYPDIAADETELVRPLTHADPTTFRAVFDFLIAVKEKELRWLHQVRETLVETGIEEWLGFFRSRFCVYRKLLFERLAESYCNHLMYSQDPAAREHQSQLLQLRDEFQEELSPD